MVQIFNNIADGMGSVLAFLYSVIPSYGLEALETYGAVRGSWLTLRRVCRCNPWGGHGYDPVPEARRRASHPAVPHGLRESSSA